jgi:hypothetical protein
VSHAPEGVAARPPVSLRTLQRAPFDLLRELERRSMAAAAGIGAGGGTVEEWVGVGFRVGDEQFVMARDEIREVLMVPPAVTRVPGAKPWLKGLANVRGHLLPLADLREFLGAGAAFGDPCCPGAGGKPQRVPGGARGGRGLWFPPLPRWRAGR